MTALAVQTDNYTLAAATLDQELSASAGVGTAVAELLSRATTDSDLADARRSVAAAFDELAGRYGAEPLPAAP